MKIFFLFFALSNVFASNRASAKDSSSCLTINEVVNLHSELLQQASNSMANSDFICNDEPSPAACKEELKSNLVKAQKLFDQSVSTYKMAGCAE
jgi:hypothetical protein